MRLLYADEVSSIKQECRCNCITPFLVEFEGSILMSRKLIGRAFLIRVTDFVQGTLRLLSQSGSSHFQTIRQVRFHPWAGR